MHGSEGGADADGQLVLTSVVGAELARYASMHQTKRLNGHKENMHHAETHTDIIQRHDADALTLSHTCILSSCLGHPLGLCPHQSPLHPASTKSPDDSIAQHSMRWHDQHDRIGHYYDDNRHAHDAERADAGTPRAATLPIPQETSAPPTQPTLTSSACPAAAVTMSARTT